MVHEEKLLLLVDLSARLPYKVKVYNTTFKEPTIQTLYGKISEDEFLMEETYTSVGVDGNDFGFFNKRHYSGYIDFIKPYLRPMSSMTEKEKEKLYHYYCNEIADNLNTPNLTWEVRCCVYNSFGIDWLNAHHFDYRRLIDKGLALEAPEDMYNTK